MGDIGHVRIGGRQARRGGVRDSPHSLAGAMRPDAEQPEVPPVAGVELLTVDHDGMRSRGRRLTPCRCRRYREALLLVDDECCDDVRDLRPVPAGRGVPEYCGSGRRSSCAHAHPRSPTARCPGPSGALIQHSWRCSRSGPHARSPRAVRGRARHAVHDLDPHHTRRHLDRSSPRRESSAARRAAGCGRIRRRVHPCDGRRIEPAGRAGHRSTRAAVSAPAHRARSRRRSARMQVSAHCEARARPAGNLEQPSSVPPLRLEMNAIARPSGDQRGSVASQSP